MKYFILLITLIFSNSIILKSFPPGWEIVDYTYNRFYWDVDCIDSLNCLAMSLIGSRTDLKKTTDGGKSWKQLLHDTVVYRIPQERQGRYEIICFDFVNENLYYMGADSGIIFKTTDGGLTWEKIKVNTNKQIISINFFNEIDGLCLTSVELLKTNDGGSNWFKVAIPDSFLKSSNPYSTYEFYSFQCPDSNSIKLHYYFGKIYFLISDDGGETWSRSVIPKKGMLSYNFLDRNNGWLVQYYQTSYTDYPNVVMQTTDGGYSWNKILDTLVKIISGLREVYFRNLNEGIACGDNGVFFRTTNGGNKWDYIISWKDDYPPHYRCCIQPSSKTVLIFTDNGYILRYDESTLNANEINFTHQFSISPNPAGEYIEIAFSSPRLKPWVASVDEIKIYNLLGECVLSVAQTFPSVDNGQTGMSDLLRIDVSDLPAGVYFVRCGDWVGRFVKI